MQKELIVVDREARDVLAECVRLFLEDQVKAEELYDVVLQYSNSDDNAVTQICFLIEEGFHEGMDEIPKNWPKSVWDEIQRYLLLLDSDFQLDESVEYIWTGWQLVAVAGALVFAGVAGLLGFVTALTWCSIPSAALSLYVSKKKTEKLNLSPYLNVLAPFDSFSSMKAALDQVNLKFGFTKMRHPKKNRPLFHLSKPISILGWVMYFVVLPTFVLLPFQALPVQKNIRRIVPAA